MGVQQDPDWKLVQVTSSPDIASLYFSSLQIWNPEVWLWGWGPNAKRPYTISSRSGNWFSSIFRQMSSFTHWERWHWASLQHKMGKQQNWRKPNWCTKGHKEHPKSASTHGAGTHLSEVSFCPHKNSPLSLKSSSLFKASFDYTEGPGPTPPYQLKRLPCFPLVSPIPC